MGMLGFLDRAIALIAVVACQKVTRDLDSLAGSLSISQAFASDYCHCPYWSTRRGRTSQKLRARKNQAAELLRQNAELERIPLDIYNREGVEI